MLRSLACTFLVTLATSPLSAQAPQQAPATAPSVIPDSALNAAKSFVGRFDEVDFGQLYDADLSPTWKALMAREMFIQQGGFLRLQSGGRALGREYIGAQFFAQAPTGARGDYYYVRFRTRYPNGLVYQDVYVEKVGTSWKISGFNMLPAPQQ